jgi:hypothetical protein
VYAVFSNEFANFEWGAKKEFFKVGDGGPWPRVEKPTKMPSKDIPSSDTTTSNRSPSVLDIETASGLFLIRS